MTLCHRAQFNDRSQKMLVKFLISDCHEARVVCGNGRAPGHHGLSLQTYLEKKTFDYVRYLSSELSHTQQGF